jgi:hypothetical protein
MLQMKCIMLFLQSSCYFSRGIIIYILWIESLPSLSLIISNANKNRETSIIPLLRFKNSKCICKKDGSNYFITRYELGRGCTYIVDSSNCFICARTPLFYYLYRLWISINENFFISFCCFHVIGPEQANL